MCKIIETHYIEVKYRFQCKECETFYTSSQSTPPPSPRWADGHVCKPVLIKKQADENKQQVSSGDG